jgi:hypothetical protein
MFGGEAGFNTYKAIGLLSGARHIMAMNEHLDSFYISMRQAAVLWRHLLWRNNQTKSYANPSLPGFFNGLLTLFAYIIIFFKITPLLLNSYRTGKKPNPFLEQKIHPGVTVVQSDTIRDKVA